MSIQLGSVSASEVTTLRRYTNLFIIIIIIIIIHLSIFYTFKLCLNGTRQMISILADYPFKRYPLWLYYYCYYLQYFDAVGWVAGRASGL